MPVLPKYIVTKLTTNTVVVGVYNTLEDAKIMMTKCKIVEDNRTKYEIFEVVKDGN